MILALLLSWGVVTLDCRGNPEAGVVYQVRAQHVHLLGWTQDDPPSPIYTPRAPLEQETPLVSLALSAYPLLPGDAAWWHVVAVDLARNDSESCP
jgi:hypothetical protein